MKVLLAIDDSAHSQAAVDAVIAQFRRDGTEVRVVTVVE
jgi:Universal stress protein family